MPVNAATLRILAQSPKNKAGQYELTRVVGGQVYYSFKNQHAKTVDSTMPLIMWQKIADRAT